MTPMEAEPSFEKFLELGDRHIGRGELERGIHYYHKALKKNLQDPAANLKLAEAYRLKAEAGKKIYYTLGMEPLRRILRMDPRNEAAHEKLLIMAFKSETLDTLVQEYGEKLKIDPADGFYAKQLQHARAMAMLDAEVNIRLPEYTPSPFIKYFFDFMVLPCGAITLVISNFGPKFKPFFVLGLAMFLFYCVYRGILYMLLRK